MKPFSRNSQAYFAPASSTHNSHRHLGQYREFPGQYCKYSTAISHKNKQRKPLVDYIVESDDLYNKTFYGGNRKAHNRH